MKYEKPMAEQIQYEAEDIITASGEVIESCNHTSTTPGRDVSTNG